MIKMLFHWKSVLLIVLLGVILYLVFGLGERHVDLGISPDKVTAVELVWLEHHYNNPSQDHMFLADSVLIPFLADFNSQIHTVPPHINTCFEIIILFKSGEHRNFVTNGHMILDVRDGEFYNFKADYNLITEYWKIHPRDFCIKSH